MNRGPLIFLGVFLTLASSWFGLVFTPFVQLGNIEPQRDKPTDVGYPEPLIGEAAHGVKVYQAMGCLYCHSQQVRPNTPTDPKDPKSEPFYSDIPRGWGSRRTVPLDYIHDRPILLGTMRTGPDLANIGKRWDAVKQHKHLYNPRFELPDSIMPAFRFLYEWKEENALPAADPLQADLEKQTDGARWNWPLPRDGKRLVPTEDARALVAYLLALKRDRDLEAKKP